MISVYILIDPRNNIPFYVGCTKRKLNDRLSGHIQQTKDHCFLNIEKYRNAPGKSTKRLHLITEIIKSGNEIIIQKIDEVSFEVADEKERFYYNHYTNLGYDMLQHEFRFTYQRKKREAMLKAAMLKNWI